MAEKPEEKPERGTATRNDRGTVRAPLFSEQVALIAQLSEPWARELKRHVEWAQATPEEKAPAAPSRGLFAASTGIVFIALLGTAAAASAMPGAPLLVLAGVGLAAVAELIGALAFRAQRSESAQLVRMLANALGKRRKEGTNPGAANPLVPPKT